MTTADALPPPCAPVPEHLAWLGLHASPFPVTPDLDGYFFSESLHAAYAELSHFIERRRGFLLITGDVGIGKTALTRRLLADMGGPGRRSALVLNTFLQGVELLRTINRDFGLQVDDPSLAGQLDALYAFLLAEHEAGRDCLLVIDDAQGLDLASLELVRQISNLETSQDKLVQIVLIAQPEILDTLARPEIRQLRSRIALHLQLEPWSAQTIDAYLHFRLERAGNADAFRMTPRALAELVRETGGNPRRINHVLDRCLYGLAARQQRILDVDLVRQAAAETGLKLPDTSADATQNRRRSKAGLLAAAVLATGATGLALWQGSTESAQTAAVRAENAASASVTDHAAVPAGAQASAGSDSQAGGIPDSVETTTRVPLADFLRQHPDLAALADRFPSIDHASLPALTQAAQSKGWQLLVASELPARGCKGQASLALGDERLLFYRSDLPPTQLVYRQADAVVSALQTRLHRLGYLPVERIDGQMGPITANALARFQSEHGLPADAQLTPRTSYAITCATQNGAIAS